MNFKMIAAAAALVATGAANASLDDFNTANSSVLFVGYNTNTGTSVTIDLGVSLNDFMPAYSQLGAPGAVSEGTLDMSNQKAVWNFTNNTYTLNGVQQSGASANSWSGNFASFLNSLSSGNQTGFKWAVIAGDMTSNVDQVGKYLTSGNPTDQQLSDQADTSNMAAINNVYTNSTSKMGSSANGSYYAGSSSDSAYVAKNTNFNTTGNWQGHLDFQAVINGSTTATSTSVLSLMSEDNTAYRVGANQAVLGQLTLDAASGTLTWSTTPAVPEPETYGLALVGLAAAFLARRRAAK